MEVGMRARIMFIVLAMVLLAGVTYASDYQAIKIEKVKYFNQPNCYKLSNSSTEVIVTTDIGPRIIAYRFIGGENILGELTPASVVKTEFGDWHPWGGHRLWHAPELKPRTYLPDDKPVKFEIVGTDAIRLTEGVEPGSNIEKEMLVQLESTGSHVTITHKLTNKGMWPVDLAPWGLTIMNGGGTTIIPNEPFISHDEKLLPARPMIIWNYTDMSDSRWAFGKKCITLHTDPTKKYPNKLGFGDKQGWAAYHRKDILFVKKFPYQEGATYPDLGCNFETYTDGDFMEIESLGQMVKLDPGKSTTHVEDWLLFSNVNADNSMASIEKYILPLVEGKPGLK